MRHKFSGKSQVAKRNVGCAVGKAAVADFDGFLCCFCNARGIFQNCHSLTRFCCSHVACLQQHAGGMMKSLILKRSVALAGHKTSVSLEDTFWRSLKEIAAYQH